DRGPGRRAGGVPAAGARGGRGGAAAARGRRRLGLRSPAPPRPPPAAPRGRGRAAAGGGPRTPPRPRPPGRGRPPPRPPPGGRRATCPGRAASEPHLRAKGGRGVLSAPLTAGALDQGVLIAFRRDEPFAPGGETLLAQAAQMLALVLATHDARRAHGEALARE